jgi:malate synthase
VATEVFDGVLGTRPNQVDRLREDVVPDAAALVDFDVPGAEITDAGLHANVSVGARYLDAWLKGMGAAAIDNLMEDVATAEISRSQVWSWVRSGRFSEADVRRELAAVDAAPEAKQLFADVALAVELPEFLTLVAYPRLPG